MGFEYELASGTVPPFVESLSRRWSHILRLLPGCRAAEALEAQETASALRIWGVTPHTYNLAQHLGLEEEFPQPGAVREVNSKVYSHRLESRYRCGLPESRLITSPEQLAPLRSDWVLKHPFGVSGRERVLGKGGEITDSARGWASKRLQEGWTLIVEPWVETEEEFSHHYEVLKSGEVRFVGWCTLLTDLSGHFRGNASRPQESMDSDTLALGHEVCRNLWESGYWGPVGIDGFTGHIHLTSIRRPLSEINARYSFGRLFLELTRSLPDSLAAVWHHPRTKTSLPPLAAWPSPKWETGCFRLPEYADPGARSGTYVQISSLDEPRLR